MEHKKKRFFKYFHFASSLPSTYTDFFRSTRARSSNSHGRQSLECLERSGSPRACFIKEINPHNDISSASSSARVQTNVEE